MIKLLKKERYYSLLGFNHYKDYQVYTVQLDKDEWRKFTSDNFYNIYFYLEEEKVCFVYINSLGLLLIPKIYNDLDSLRDKILSSKTTLENWKVDLIKKVDPRKHKYLLNTFRFGEFSDYLTVDSSQVKDNNNYDREVRNVYISGEYKITNTDFPEDSTEFSLKSGNKYSYWPETYIAFDEKEKLITSSNKNKLEYIETLIAIILNSNGRDYQEPYIKSE